VLGIEALFACHHGPQDASVLVGHGHAGLLPTDARRQLSQPQRSGIGAFAGAHDSGLGTLDHQRAQIVVATFGDTSQTGLAAAGVLAGHQAEPGAELMAAVELPEVADAGGQCRGAEFTDAGDAGGALSRRAGAHMLADLRIAPMQVLVELAPVVERALQDQAGHRAEFVAGVLDDIGEFGAQGLGALCEDQAELGQQAADAVDAGGAFFLEAFAHAVQAHHALLLTGLDRHEAHARAGGCLADGGGIGGVVLATAAFHAIGADEVARRLRAQWCALEHASLATRQPGFSGAHQARNCSRLSERVTMRRPAASTAWTWITRLARSTPTRAIKARVISLMDFPFSDSD